MAEERLRRILSHASIPVVGATCTPSSTYTSTSTANTTWSQSACGAAEEPRINNMSQQPSATAVNAGHNDDDAEISRNCLRQSNYNSSQSSRSHSRMEADSNVVEEEFIIEHGGTDGINEFSKSQQHLMPGTGTISLNRASTSWPRDRGCIFCNIIHGYEHAFKLYEDDFCICILDINPLCYGHSLLVPKGHFPSLDVTPPQVAAAMCSVVPLISNVIMEATSCDAFNLVVNSGEAAGQVVFHTHFHIVPRFAGDGLWTNESVNRKTLSTFKDPTQLVHAVHTKLAKSRTKR